MSGSGVQRQEKQPARAEVEEVAPDILRMQLPISLPGLGHVNCYALVDDRGLAVVDPGLPGKKNFKALQARLKSAGFTVRDIHSVIVTHSHHDHFGGAAVIRDEAGADVITHKAFRTWFDASDDADAGPDEIDDDLADDDADRPRPAPGFPTEKPWGGDGKFGPPLRRRVQIKVMKAVGSRWMKAPAPNRRVDHDDVLTFGGREWLAVHTPGHTTDHLCLFSPTDGVLLSGDHVLPTITPHISGMTAGADPLDEFFASLDLVAGLEGATLALPAHGYEFDDVAGRCDDIKEHHVERLQKLRDAATAEGEASVVTMSHHLFRERSWGPMAESETYAHLEHLRHQGEMTSRRIDGEVHYALVPEAGASNDGPARSDAANPA